MTDETREELEASRNRMAARLIIIGTDYEKLRKKADALRKENEELRKIAVNAAFLCAWLCLPPCSDAVRASLSATIEETKEKLASIGISESHGVVYGGIAESARHREASHD